MISVFDDLDLIDMLSVKGVHIDPSQIEAESYAMKALEAPKQPQMWDDVEVSLPGTGRKSDMTIDTSFLKQPAARSSLGLRHGDGDILLQAEGALAAEQDSGGFF